MNTYVDSDDGLRCVGRSRSADAVRRTLNFETVDYLPIYDVYWGGFLAAWRQAHDLPPLTGIPLDDVVMDDAEILNYYHIDLFQATPDEQPWPSLQSTVECQGEYTVERDGWGRTIRRRSTSPYGEVLETSLQSVNDLEGFEFEPVDSDRRYTGMHADIRLAQGLSHQPYVFLKVGGPFLRASFLRGESRWYMDIASDPGFVSALAERVTDLLIGVGVEGIRRAGPATASIWIFDDVASNQGLLISPASYERLFLPQVRRMVTAFKAAGIEHVGFHSDGDIRSILDGLVDAGISVLNPLEPRANMDVATIRRRFGRRLAFVGGLCNSNILPRGSDDDVRRHVEDVLSVAQDGGLVPASHSIGPDISLERYDFLMNLLSEHRRPRPGNGTSLDG